MSNEQQEWDALQTRAEAELDSEDLDSEIHDLHSKDAAAINNSGMDGQIDYIVHNYGVAYATQVLTALLQSKGKS